eukprot:gene17855-biopygen27076
MHEEAYRLANSIGTDASLTAQELQIFDDIGKVFDPHPEAHALRCKVSLHTIDSPLIYGWYLPKEAIDCIEKLSCIGAACRLTREEENLLMEVADSTTRKMEIIAQRAKDDSVGWRALVERVNDPAEALLEGSLLERQQVKAFVDAIQRVFREKLGIRCPWDDTVRFVSIFLKHVDDDIPYCKQPYQRCLLANHVAFCSARAKGETWAHCEVPEIGGDTYMNFKSDIGSLSSTPSLRISHSFQKNMKGQQSLELVHRVAKEYLDARRRTPPARPNPKIHEGS